MTEQASKSGFAPVNDTELYYEIHGTDHAETLVMVHAGICDSRMWQQQVSHFAEKYRVITYDMRGFGKSPIGEGAFSFHTDLQGLLSHLEVDSALFMGCSMGGRTVIDFALTQPETVRGLVLVGSAISGYTYHGEPHPLNDEINTVYDQGDLEGVSELEVQMWVDGKDRSPSEVDPAVRRLVYEMNLIPLGVDEDLWDMEESLDPPAMEQLESITQPTLLVIGDLDVISSIERTDILEERLPNAKKVVMNGTAHVPNMEFPEQFNQIVDAFLARL